MPLIYYISGIVVLDITSFVDARYLFDSVSTLDMEDWESRHFNLFFMCYLLLVYRRTIICVYPITNQG